MRTLYGTDGKSSYYIAADGDVVIGGKYDDDKGVRPAFWYAWAETEYKITYTVGDGANVAEGNPTSYTRYKDTTKNNAVTISNAPSRTGYVFKGWKLKGTEDSTAKTSYTITADTTGDIELVAVWEEKQYLTRGDAISNVGDIIFIGKKNTTDTSDNIAWKALKVDTTNKIALLISQDILEKKAYDDNSITYSGSEIQKYLTSDLFFTTYSLSTDYMVKGNITAAETTSSGGSDYVFLLSDSEIAQKYFISANDQIAKYKGTAIDWWSRPSGDKKLNYFLSSGSYASNDTYNTQKGIRPAFWYKWN